MAFDIPPLYPAAHEQGIKPASGSIAFAVAHKQRDDHESTSPGSLHPVGISQKPDLSQNIMLKRDLALAQKQDIERFGNAPLRQRARKASIVHKQTPSPQRIPQAPARVSASQPLKPVQPLQAAHPVQPAQPAIQPLQVAHPAQASQPVIQPLQAAQPVQPAQHAQAVQPIQQPQPTVNVPPATTSSVSAAQHDPRTAEIAVLQAKLAQLKEVAALKEQINQLQAQQLAQPSELARQAQARPQPERQEGNSTPHDPRDPSNLDHKDFYAIHTYLTKTGQWREPQTTNIAADLLLQFRTQPFGKQVDMVGVETDSSGKAKAFAGFAPWGEKNGCLSIGSTEPAQAAKIPAAQSFDKLAQINAHRQSGPAQRMPQHAV